MIFVNLYSDIIAFFLYRLVSFRHFLKKQVNILIFIQLFLSHSLTLSKSVLLLYDKYRKTFTLSVYGVFASPYIGHLTALYIEKVNLNGHRRRKTSKNDTIQ